jgi:antitoxin PrlF
VRITAKGQVTIPRRLRDQFGLMPDTEVSFESTGRGILIRPAHNLDEEIARRLAKATGSATVPITTDEIMGMTRGDE